MKLRMLIALSLMIWAFSSIANTEVTANKINKITTKLSEDSLISYLRKVVAFSKPNRMPGTTGHQSTLSFLEKFLKQLKSGQTRVDSFLPDIDDAKKFYVNDFNSKIEGQYPNSSSIYKKWYGFTQYMSSELDKFKTVKGHNLIWERKGKKKKYLVIGAHYDSIIHDKKTLKIDYDSTAPGADYNASGVSVAMGLAQVINQVSELEYGVKIILWDYHIFASLGAKNYIENLKDKNQMIGYINLEMLGHDSKALDKNKKYGNMAAYIRKKESAGYDKDIDLINIFLVHDSVCKDKVEFELKPNGADFSDHFRFWKSDIPAVVFSQNWEVDFNDRGYQSKDDFVETINKDTLYGVYRYLSCTIVSWLHSA